MASVFSHAFRYVQTNVKERHEILVVAAGIAIANAQELAFR